MSPNPRATWGLVTTAAEPPELLAAFAAHHLALGASEVRICLDDCSQESFDLLKQIPGCTPVMCDDAYWASLRDSEMRPRAHTRRQRLNATHAHHVMQVDWVGHLDADEFLLPGGDFGEELASQPADLASLRVLNGERAWVGTPDPEDSIFGGKMRRQISNFRQLKAQFGEAARFTEAGMASYIGGKHFNRTGLPIWIGIHGIGLLEGNEPRELRIEPAKQALICHFDGLTPLNWALKMVRYDERGKYAKGMPRSNRHRYFQVTHVAEHKGTPQAIRELHDLIKVVPEAKAAALVEAGNLVDHGVDPAAALRRLGLDLHLDFSQGHFDDWLRINRPHLSEFLGAWERDALRVR